MSGGSASVMARWGASSFFAAADCFLKMGGDRPSLRHRHVLVGRLVVVWPTCASEAAEGERLEYFLCLRVGLGQLPGMYGSVEN